MLNSHRRRTWSFAQVSLKVKVTGAKKAFSALLVACKWFVWQNIFSLSFYIYLTILFSCLLFLHKIKSTFSDYVRAYQHQSQKTNTDVPSKWIIGQHLIEAVAHWTECTFKLVTFIFEMTLLFRILNVCD